VASIAHKEQVLEAEQQQLKDNLLKAEHNLQSSVELVEQARTGSSVDAAREKEASDQCKESFLAYKQINTQF